jgi:hypothetical protein
MIYTYCVVFLYIYKYYRLCNYYKTGTMITTTINILIKCTQLPCQRNLTQKETELGKNARSHKTLVKGKQ